MLDITQKLIVDYNVSLSWILKQERKSKISRQELYTKLEEEENLIREVQGKLIDCSYSYVSSITNWTAREVESFYISLYGAVMDKPIHPKLIEKSKTVLNLINAKL